MKISSWMILSGAVLCGAAQAQTPQNTAGAPAQPQRGTQERSTNSNNSAVRAQQEKGAAARINDEDARFGQVRGGPATDRKDWKKGDPRGKPQDPSQALRSRRHKRPPKQPKAAQ